MTGPVDQHLAIRAGDHLRSAVGAGERQDGIGCARNEQRGHGDRLAGEVGRGLPVAVEVAVPVQAAGETGAGELADVVAVQTTRDILEGAKKGLEFVRPVAVDLTYIPVVGHALSAAFQAPFCAGAMAVVGGALAYLVVKTLINATQLLKLLAKLAELVAAAIADIISDVADIIKGILGEVWEFITNALNGLKELWDKLTGWVTGLFSRGWSNLESFFAGVPGLTGATSGLSQVTGLFGAAGLSASSGLAHADSLASSASLPALAGIGGGSGFGGLPSLAQVHAASTRQALRPRADGPVGAAAEQVGGQSQLVSAQGSQGMGGPVGMGGMHPSSGASKGTTTKKYSEGAAAGTEDAERAPVEADAGGGQKVLVRNVV